MPKRDYLLDTKPGKYKILKVIKEFGDLDLACTKLNLTKEYLENDRRWDFAFDYAIKMTLKGDIPKYYDREDVRKGIDEGDMEAIMLTLCIHQPEKWGSISDYE